MCLAEVRGGGWGFLLLNCWTRGVGSIIWWVFKTEDKRSMAGCQRENNKELNARNVDQDFERKE